MDLHVWTSRTSCYGSASQLDGTWSRWRIRKTEHKAVPKRNKGRTWIWTTHWNLNSRTTCPIDENDDVQVESRATTTRTWPKHGRVSSGIRDGSQHHVELQGRYTIYGSLWNFTCGFYEVDSDAILNSTGALQTDITVFERAIRIRQTAIAQAWQAHLVGSKQIRVNPGNPELSTCFWRESFRNYRHFRISQICCCRGLVGIFQKISNRTHWTEPEKKTWVSNSWIVTSSSGSGGIWSHSIFGWFFFGNASP